MKISHGAKGYNADIRSCRISPPAIEAGRIQGFILAVIADAVIGYEICLCMWGRENV